MSAVSGNNNFWTRGRVKVACHFPFWERKFYVISALGSESSRERKFQGMKVPPMELSLLGAKVRGNESSSYLFEHVSCVSCYHRVEQTVPYIHDPVSEIILV